MSEEEIKLREYLIILNEENPTHKKENVNFSIINLFEKQQKEIKTRLEEIDSLYKMMSAKDDEIEYLADKIEQMKEDYQILKDDIEGHRIVYVDTPEFEENYISKDKIRDIIFEFIPKSIHEVELRTKIIKLLGETND